MNNENILNIPNDFSKVNSMPSDPPNSTAYIKQTQNSNCFAMVYPINSNSAMPYDNIKIVIDQIHDSLAEDQGLIEVVSGHTNMSNKYIYSIIKTQLNPSGMQYTLTMNIDKNNYSICVQSFFDEIGDTGLRDSIILNKLANDGMITLPEMEGWLKDPYDPNFKRGILKNFSENKEFDKYFPQHPLSETRNLIKYIIEHN